MNNKLGENGYHCVALPAKFVKLPCCASRRGPIRNIQRCGGILNYCSGQVSQIIYIFALSAPNYVLTYVIPKWTITTFLINMVQKSSNNQWRTDDKPVDASGYQSHDSVRPAVRGDQSIKETLFTAQQFNSISKLASNCPVSDTRLEMYNERKALHAKSNERIKKWGNTVNGLRLKRLAAADETNRATEVLYINSVSKTKGRCGMGPCESFRTRKRN